MCQLATLMALRLVVKSGGSVDILEGFTKWKVNIGWETIREIARGVEFDIESYLID